MPPKDFLFRGELAELDPDIAELIHHETARQAHYLILIASEAPYRKPSAKHSHLPSTICMRRLSA